MRVMQRIDHVTAAPDLFGAGRPGFQGGDAAAQVPATVLTPAWCNHIQEAIARAIEAGGEGMDPADYGQLARIIMARGASALPVNNTWTGSNHYQQDVLLDLQAQVRADTYRQVTKLLPLSALMQGALAGAGLMVVMRAAELEMYSDTLVPVELMLDLNGYVPPQSRIIALRAGVVSAADPGDGRIRMELYRVTPNLTTAAASTVGTTIDRTAPGAGNHVLEMASLLAPITDSSFLRLRIVGSTGSSVNDRDVVRWVEVRYEGYFPSPYF